MRATGDTPPPPFRKVAIGRRFLGELTNGIVVSVAPTEQESSCEMSGEVAWKDFLMRLVVLVREVLWLEVGEHRGDGELGVEGEASMHTERLSPNLAKDIGLLGP